MLKVLLYYFLILAQTDIAWGFQMSYFSSLQNCDLSKLEVKEKSWVSPELLSKKGFDSPQQEFLFYL